MYLCEHRNVKVMYVKLVLYTYFMLWTGGGTGSVIMIHMLVFACLSGFPLACVTCTKCVWIQYKHTSLPIPPPAFLIYAYTPCTQHMLFTFPILIHVYGAAALFFFSSFSKFSFQSNFYCFYCGADTRNDISLQTIIFL